MQVSEEVKKYPSGGKRTVIKLQQAKLDYGGVCSWGLCTKTANLQLAHRHGFEVNDGGWRSSWVRWKMVRDTPAFLFPLCPEHHQEYDALEDDEEDSY